MSAVAFVFRAAIVPSQTVTAGGNVVYSQQDLGRFHRALLLLNVTSAATAAGDTLDVYVQKNVGPVGATVWTDFVHFSQVLGNGGAKQYVAELVNDGGAPTNGNHAVQSAALAAATTNQGPWSDDWRVQWVVASANAPSFTFELDAALWA